MKHQKKIENVIRDKLHFAAGSNLHDRLLAQVLQAQEQSKETTPAPREPIPRRTIMRSPIGKLASAAAILMAAVVVIGLWGKLSAPAYAIEQTYEALQNVRFLHVIGRDDAGQINEERWIEVGDDGYQIRYRQRNPPSPVEQYPSLPSLIIEDGNSTAVYRHDKKAVILYDRKDQQYQWIGPLGEFFENLRNEGKILKENDEYQGRRVHKVWWPAISSECYIDPETKLPIAIGKTELSYEEPPATTFKITIPEGWAVLDKRPGAPAGSAPDWLVAEERAERDKEECFRQGTRALIRGDYAEAAEQLENAIGYDSWALFWLGRAHHELGRYELAIENYNALFDAFTKAGAGETIPFCQYARGLAYARLGMEDAARADLEACLPAMIRTLRIPSGGAMFEYADNPMIRYGQYEPGEREIVIKMINRLRITTGQGFGYDPDAADEQNEAAIAAWEQWLKTDGQIRFTPDAKLIPVPSSITSGN